jgi:hypothetical protein
MTNAQQATAAQIRIAIQNPAQFVSQSQETLMMVEILTQQ